MLERGLRALNLLAVVVLATSLVAPLVPAPSSAPEPLKPAGYDDADGPVRAYLEAVHQRTDLRQLEPSTHEQRLICTPARTLSTTHRPVVLLDRDEAGCGTHERIELTLYLSARDPFRLEAVEMALCQVPTYRMSTFPSGEMISDANVTSCQPLEVEMPGADGPDRKHRVPLVLPEHAFPGPGLQVVCAAANVELPDGTHALSEDLTWFEVWSLEDPPSRDAYRQSIAEDTPCENLDAPWAPEFTP
ncbi:MAG: hypothetical protein R3185_01760 [Candidatus Thermoplasmatota archaeon]|nr:hypothetical protein [Candidatus Thermoplasmatota archaeon]